MFEIVPHTADIGIRVHAADLDTLFAEAGQALFSIIAGDLEDIQLQVQHEVRVAKDVPEYMLIDWLNELLYLFESQQLLLRRFDVAIGQHGVRATVAGEPLDESRHRLEHEVKAITYHALKVQPTENGWTVEVIVDI